MVRRSSSDALPRELDEVVAHARRLAKVLARMEGELRGTWVRGRSGELKAVVSCLLDDWRSHRIDDALACARLGSYVDGLHREAARRRRPRGVALDCCSVHEAITVVGRDGSDSIDAASQVGNALDEYASTARCGWVDSPEVLERFRQGLGVVERQARAMRRRVGKVCELEDLQAYGREGLLDAARSFNETRGVPFEAWASLRVQNSMMDGVRRWGDRPRGAAHDAARVAGSLDSSDSSDSVEVGAAKLAMVVATALAERSSALSVETPEETASRREVAQSVRAAVKQLPATERELIERHYFQEQTVEQAARALGIDRSWAGRLLNRAVESIVRAVDA